MTQAPRFCLQCGAPLDADARQLLGQVLGTVLRQT